MNLPFGLPIVKDLGIKRREETKEITAMYEHKLAEYRDTLEYYKKLLEYSDKLEENDRKSLDKKYAGVQAAMDLTYLKEQGEKTIELIEDMNKSTISNIMTELEKLNIALLNTNENLEGIDKNVINRLSELLIELQKQNSFQYKQYQSDITAHMGDLEHRVKKGHALLWFLFVFNLISISGIVFLILYSLEIIPFY